MAYLESGSVTEAAATPFEIAPIVAPEEAITAIANMYKRALATARYSGQRVLRRRESGASEAENKGNAVLYDANAARATDLETVLTVLGQISVVAQVKVMK